MIPLYDVVVDYGNGVNEVVYNVSMSIAISILRGCYFGPDRHDNIKVTIRPVGHDDAQRARTLEE